jgi:hypothetical protein
MAAMMIPAFRIGLDTQSFATRFELPVLGTILICEWGTTVGGLLYYNNGR